MYHGWGQTVGGAVTEPNVFFVDYYAEEVVR